MLEGMTILKKEKVQKRPRRSLTQGERTALSNSRMFETAINLIVRHGVEGMTLKEVGEIAGYSRGLAGYRFGSKKDLLAHIIHSIGDEWVQELTPVTRNKVGLEAICAAVRAHFCFCRDAPNHVLAFYILWFESITPGSLCKDVMLGIHERRKKDISDWVRKGIEQKLIEPTVHPDVIAEQFCSAIIGIVYHWVNKPTAMSEVKKLHEGLEEIMTMLLSKKQKV